MPNAQNMRNAGFGTVLIVAVVAVVLLVAGVVAYNRSSSTTKDNAATNKTSNPPAQQRMASPPQQPVNPYEGMTQYANATYGLSFYHPSEWRVEERDPKTTYIEPVELSLALVDTAAGNTPTVATVAVSTSSLSEVGPAGDGDPTKFRQELTVKGKQAVKYSIPQSATVNREMYYIAAGGKTYWLQTSDEEANVARTPDYMAKFNKLVDSLTLP